MPIPYETFIKHADKVCKSETDSSTKNPILRGIKLLGNGDAVVTDAHRLYLAKGIHNQRETVITSSGKKLEGNYPDVYRLIPTVEPQQEIKLQVKELLEATDAIYSVGRVIESESRMQFINNLVKYDSPLVKYQREFDVTFEVPCFVNAEYLLDAVQLFKAVGSSQITLQFYGVFRPMKMTNGDESLIVLVLPIRKY